MRVASTGTPTSNLPPMLAVWVQFLTLAVYYFLIKLWCSFSFPFTSFIPFTSFMQKRLSFYFCPFAEQLMTKTVKGIGPERTREISCECNWCVIGYVVPVEIVMRSVEQSTVVWIAQTFQKTIEINYIKINIEGHLGLAVTIERKCVV